MKMNKFFKQILFVVTLLLSFISSQAQIPADWKQMKAAVNLYWVNDMGRNGYYDQKTIAQLMGTMAETVGPEAVIAVGDIHHFNGVQSVTDP